MTIRPLYILSSLHHPSVRNGINGIGDGSGRTDSPSHLFKNPVCHLSANSSQLTLQKKNHSNNVGVSPSIGVSFFKGTPNKCWSPVGFHLKPHKKRVPSKRDRPLAVQSIPPNVEGMSSKISSPLVPLWTARVGPPPLRKRISLTCACTY